MEFCLVNLLVRAFQVVRVVNNLPASARDLRTMGSIPGSGRSPGEGHGKPLQYSCLENPMDRGAWQAKIQTVVHGIARVGLFLSYSLK